MVLPLIAAGLAGAVGGFALDEWIGGSKKDQTTNNNTNSQVYHQPYETYSPTTTTVSNWQPAYIYNPSYQVQISSPSATMTKKDELSTSQSATQNPYVAPQYYQPQTYSQSPNNSQGTDMTKLAIIGVVGLVAYGLVSNK